MCVHEFLECKLQCEMCFGLYFKVHSTKCMLSIRCMYALKACISFVIYTLGSTCVCVCVWI